jgi:hypothetical protein
VLLQAGCAYEQRCDLLGDARRVTAGAIVIVGGAIEDD